MPAGVCEQMGSKILCVGKWDFLHLPVNLAVNMTKVVMKVVKLHN